MLNIPGTAVNTDASLFRYLLPKINRFIKIRLDRTNFLNYGRFCFIMPRMPNRFNRFWAIPIALFVLLGIYLLPPIRSRVDSRLDAVRSQIKYLINPPEDATFQPAQQSIKPTSVVGTLPTQPATSTPQTALTP